MPATVFERCFVVLAFATCASGGPARRGPSEACTNELALVGHDVDFSIEADVLRGSGWTTLRPLVTTSCVLLDARELTVSSVGDGERSFPFELDGRHLRVHLPRPVEAGNELRLHSSWTAAIGGAGLRRAGGVVWAGYGTERWLPTLRDSAQRGTLVSRWTVPSSMTVVASGRRLPVRVVEGKSVHEFRVETPTPPFLFAFAAGALTEARLDSNGVGLRALGPAGVDLSPVLDATDRRLRLLTELLGAPVPGSEYAQVFVEGDEAQEAAGFSLQSIDVVTELKAKPEEEWAITHELAHQWFGWRVPCRDFRDFWLNEGFATFLVGVVKERLWGKSAFEAERKGWRERSDRVHQKGKDAPLSLSGPGGPARSIPDDQLQARGVTYFRGALTLERLRSELGEEVFWRGVQQFIRERDGKGATSDDLRRALESASGRELRAFFETRVFAPAWD